MTARVRRWPLHPEPAPTEALSSWLERTASLYDLSAQDLLGHNLGSASIALAAHRDLDLDWDPPHELLLALAERTGLGLDRLRPMTIAGWIPWLTDTLDLDNGQVVFDTYVRGQSVLFKPGKARRNRITRWRSWLPIRPIRLACPVCLAEPEPRESLLWRVPVMVTCTEHGCRLEPAADIKWAVLSGLDVPAVPAIAHTLAMDRLTFGGLRTGRVRLPGGSMHIGVWFRLLRTLIDELSTSTATLTVGSRQAVDTIWRVLAAPARAGLTVFRPYEQLDWQHQQILMHAAAVALHLVETGEVTARGTLGHYLARQPHRPVPEGDRRAWQFKQAVAELDAMVIRARTDRDTAHQLMAWYDIGSDRSSSFDRARELMLGLDIPVHYLPDSREALRSRLRELPRQDRSTSTEPSGSGFS